MVRVHVLGELELDVDGAPLVPPPSRRARSLLGFLALHPGPHPRSTLAARFWPDVLDESARTSLRGALTERASELAAAAVAEADELDIPRVITPDIAALGRAANEEGALWLRRAVRPP